MDFMWISKTRLQKEEKGLDSLPPLLNKTVDAIKGIFKLKEENKQKMDNSCKGDSDSNDLLNFIVKIDSEIDDGSATEFQRKFEEKINKAIYFELDYGIKCPITVFVNSPGGSVISGWRIIKEIENCGWPVNTVAENMVASMGIPILLTGNKRYATKRTEFLIHSISSGTAGKYQDMEDNLNAVKKQFDYLKEYIADRTKLPYDFVEKISNREYFFFDEEAIKLNVVHEIIDSKTPFKFSI